MELAQQTATVATSRNAPPMRPGHSWLDWLYAAALVLGALFAWSRYHAYMDIYEQVILGAAAATFIVLGWRWASMRNLVLGCGALALVAISAYDGDLGRAEKAFFLKYFLSSQTAVLWMSVLFFAATLLYWVQILRGDRIQLAGQLATGVTWAAVVMGTTGMLVRWYESYLIGTDIGHIPISNLYEVFVLFSVITALFHLFYEARYGTKALGAFVLLVISAAVAFLLWYTFDRGAHEIQPLVPALQSWWMKIHVPANFIGYGCFALAAMLSLAFLVKNGANTWWVLVGLLAMGALFFGGPALLGQTGKISAFWVKFFVVLCVVTAALSVFRTPLAARLPAAEVLDDITYKSIAVGFGFFTVATILGALWAADAWGAYWQWDPKETWALIVWLNYAAWLHMRLINGLRGNALAWWSLVGLLITTFAFLGVNIFLSGLHSYGNL